MTHLRIGTNHANDKYRSLCGGQNTNSTNNPPHPIYGRLMRIAFRKGFKSGVEWYKRINLTGLK